MGDIGQNHCDGPRTPDDPPSSFIEGTRKMTTMHGLRYAALAAAGLLVTVLAESVSAQTSDSLIAEVMRKGLAREPENGFCNIVPWPVERSTADTGRFYSTASPGVSKVFKDTYSGPDPYCAYILVDDVRYEGNARCVYAQMWWCHFGQSCHHRRYRGCEGSDGVLRWDD